MHSACPKKGDHESGIFLFFKNASLALLQVVLDLQWIVLQPFEFMMAKTNTLSNEWVFLMTMAFA